jgi:hypothetical protein
MQRIRRCEQNNAMMEHLGLLVLSNIVFNKSVAHQTKEKNKHNDDPDIDCNGEYENNSEDDLSDDILVPANMKSAHGCSKLKV